ncbi:mannonate dehydratase [Candidatus Latescibacterota bacterium]
MTPAKHIEGQGNIHCTRRTFGKMALSGVAGMGAFVNSSAPARAQTKDLPGPPYAGDYVSHMKPNPSNLKVGLGQFPANADHERLMYARQFGIEWVCIPGVREATAENYIALKNRFGKYGIKIWRLGNQSLHNVDAITLNFPNRDEKVAEYIQYLRNLKKAGIKYTTYAHMADSVWHTKPEPIRGGIGAVTFSWEQAKNGGARQYKGKQRIPDKPIHGRVYSEKEIWDNYEYFIRKVAPVAEECDVRIGIHPDDPPLPMLGGVPRCIFSSFEGYRRAMEIADSPNVGLCLCVGCWLEGGDRMGKNVLETIRYFGERNKLFKIHVRNVEMPLSRTNPYFREAWIDDGYMDMYLVMKELRIANNDCLIIDDHHPPGTIGGWMVGKAFQLGYIRALLERANEEVG